MDYKMTILVLFMAAALTALGYLIGHRMAELQYAEPMSIQPLNFALPRARDVKGDGRDGLPSQNEVRVESLVDICAVDWTYWVNAPASDLEDEVINRRQLLSQDCRDRMFEEIGATIVRNFITQCQDEVMNLSVNQLFTYCLPRLEIVRGYVVRRFSPRQAAQVSALPVDDLQNLLRGGLLSLSNQSRDEIDKNIEIADVLSKKDPDSPMVYKAKLVSLLVKEIKYGEDVDPFTYDDLVSMTDEGDVAHLPFLRLSALGRIGELREISLNYIDRNPDSYLGYLYLAESLWREGNTRAAFSVIQQGLGESNSADVPVLFSQLQKEPLKRIYELVDYH